MLTRRQAEIWLYANGGAQRVGSRLCIGYALNMQETARGVVVAREWRGALDAGRFPVAAAWDTAEPIRFDWDWQGENADPLRETEVRLLWTTEMFYVRFRCRYRTLTVYADGEPSGRRNELWNRDVAEMFLQPAPEEPRRYWEFELAPNGMWIDLDISPGEHTFPKLGRSSQVVRRDAEHVWIADLALPISEIVRKFDPSAEWRVNFFRAEGEAEPRFYSAWQPTHTPKPNFHVPEAFGVLRFRR